MADLFLAGQSTTRCPKCYRTHNLEYFDLNQIMHLGVRCPFHKKPGYYFIYTFTAQYNLNLNIHKVIGNVKEIKPRMYEVQVLSKMNNSTSIQEKLDL